ncbi:MAG: hypothetical protein J2P17_17495, partial [Mycobacterium sp.]|nr:hypothetical protein [Mycobacterium sp.]
AGDNDVAVVRLAGSSPGHGSGDGDIVAGLIPTAWYPTGVQVANHGSRLLVTSAKGLGVGPNPDGPNPLTGNQGPTTGDPATDQYIVAMMRGRLSIITVPHTGQLAHYTQQVRRNNGFTAHGPVVTAGLPSSSVIPRRVGQPSPIKHVIYVIKENRTYDQVLGDLGRGNGDPDLALFGPNVAPNQHQLAKQFVTLDNFYADGETTNHGWEWTSAANTNTYNETVTPGTYTFNGRAISPGPDSEHAYDAAENPQAAYIWDKLIAAHRNFRNYGFSPTGFDAALAAYSDPNFAGFNTAITDRSRIQEWQREYANYEQTNTLPPFEIMELGDDHTSGTSPGGPTPSAQVADNDYALGQLVDTVSHSKDWKDTAIFVVEDDAQDGADHVDAHRIPAQVISPYTQYGTVDSTLYSQASTLHTIELILGLAPMSQFDAAATPLVASFKNKPNLTPYDQITPTQNMDETNSASAPMAQQSERWNFTKADAAPDDLLNKAIWESVKGANTPMPSPMTMGAPEASPHRAAKAQNPSTPDK